MEYKGKLYGRVGNTYFPLIETTDDVENLKRKISELETENKMLEKACTRAQDIAEDLQSKLSYLLRQPRA